ncbi:type VII secretion protein EccE [Rhodococcus sp. 3Y1]
MSGTFAICTARTSTAARSSVFTLLRAVHRAPSGRIFARRCRRDRSPRDYLTRIGRHSFDASHLLPTAALANCLYQHDISLTGIDIVSHGYRAASGTPATEVYERLIGPLPATATRSVWLALRFDALEGGAAVERRGGANRAPAAR